VAGVFAQVSFGTRASGLIIGMFASAKDLLDGLYQYPGGMDDRPVRRKRRSCSSRCWRSSACGLCARFALGRGPRRARLVMAWKAGAFPATFAVIGDSLPPGRRAIAFSVQSILVRAPGARCSARRAPDPEFG